MTRGKILLFGLLFATAAGGLGWRLRGPLMAWWHVRELSQADDSTRAARVVSFETLGEDAIAPLLAALRNQDETACRNIDLGLRAATGAWSADDPRTLRTIQAVRAAFAGFSVEGKKASLHFSAAFASRLPNGSLPAVLARQLGELMSAGEADSELRPAALGLAGALLECGPAGQWDRECRALAIKGMSDKCVATRVAAIQLALREPLRKDSDLLVQIAPSLRDSDPDVRRVALLALGPNGDAIREELLMPLLHDAEPEIQHLCEIALRSRGLNDLHVRFARLISHADPNVRMEVLPLLRQAVDLDTDVWLRRLTLDPAPAVRAAAARLASQAPSDDLRQRLAEMAQTDTSETVREIAQFYVGRPGVRNIGN